MAPIFRVLSARANLFSPGPWSVLGALFQQRPRRVRVADRCLLSDAEGQCEVEWVDAAGECSSSNWPSTQGRLRTAVGLRAARVLQNLPAGPSSTAVFWVISRWGLAVQARQNRQGSCPGAKQPEREAAGLFSLICPTLVTTSHRRQRTAVAMLGHAGRSQHRRPPYAAPSCPLSRADDRAVAGSRVGSPAGTQRPRSLR